MINSVHPPMLEAGSQANMLQVEPTAHVRISYFSSVHQSVYQNHVPESQTAIRGPFNWGRRASLLVTVARTLDLFQAASIQIHTYLVVPGLEMCTNIIINNLLLLLSFLLL
jgi:hypothetical protein